MPVSGDDTVSGGPGTDGVEFYLGPLTVDLARPEPQQTGAGLMTITGVENVHGSAQADTLLGGPAPNRIDGFDGADTIDGRGGSDELIGGNGIDTVPYTDAPGPVAVDLAAGRATQGADTDTLSLVENVLGSPFADSLTGDPLANRLEGGAGVDTIAAGSGDDTVLARDGEGDTVTCGAGADSATSDRRSLDALGADCETVDALPEPVVEQPDPRPGDPDGPGGGPVTPDRTLRLSLTGARAQRVLAQKAVRVVVSCPTVACTTVASAAGTVKLKPVTTRLAAGASKTVKLRLSAKQLKTLRAAKRPALTVSVTARDAAGTRVVRTLRVTVKR